MGRGRARIYNLIFLVLSLLWVIFVISRLLAPAGTRPQTLVELPTVVVLPTLEPSNTPTITPVPTDTLTPTATLTPTITPTETIAPTASATITDTPPPTSTPTSSPTPAATATPLPTETPAEPPTPAPPTLSPYPFELRNNEVLYVPNINTAVGCAWQGIAGQVFDQAGNPLLIGLRVHVFGGPDNLDRYQDTGSNSIYGASGWEQPVATSVSSSTYFVQLESAGGTPLSELIQVSFGGDCTGNLALVNFIQIRPL
jgi:hypothetical protein